MQRRKHNSFSNIPFYLIILLILAIPPVCSILFLIYVIKNHWFLYIYIHHFLCNHHHHHCHYHHDHHLSHCLFYILQIITILPYHRTHIHCYDTMIIITIRIHICPYRNHHHCRYNNHHRRDNCYNCNIKTIIITGCFITVTVFLSLSSTMPRNFLSFSSFQF